MEPMEDDEDDPFAAILKFCRPAASQVAKLRTCPLYSFPFATPGSQNSADQQTQDNEVFHTPPDHHLQSNRSSSEDLNPHELCAGGATTVDLDGSRKVRGFDSGHPESEKKVRVPGKGVGGSAIAGKGVVNESVGDEIVDLCSEDSDKETVDVDSQYRVKECRVEFGVGGGGVKKSAGLKKQRVSIVDASGEKNVLGSMCDEPMRDTGVDRGDNKCLVVDNELGKGAKVSGNEKTSKDGNRDEGRRTACRRIEEIDEFRFSGWDGAGRKWKDTPMPSKRKRELPASMMEMNKNEGRSNLLGEGVENSGGLNKGKQKIEGGWNEAGKVDTKSGQLNRGKDKEGGINAVGKVDARPGQLNKGKGKNDGGSNEAGEMDTKSRKAEGKIDQSESEDGMEKNGGSNEAGEMETKSRNAEAKIDQSGSEDGMEKNGGSNVEGTGEKKKKKKGGLMDCLGILRTIIKNMEKDGQSNDDNVDILATAKKLGVTFPRPRWWPPEGEKRF